MKITLLAAASALLFSGVLSGAAFAQSGYDDREDGYQDSRYERDDRRGDDDERYQRVDLDRDGVDDRHDLYDNRNRVSWDRDRDGRNDRYDRPGGGYNPNADERYGDGRYDRDGRHDRDDRNERDRRHDGSRRFSDRRYAHKRYRAERYLQPRNYRYSTFDLGSRLPSGYWGSSYYVDNRSYGLSAPPRGYRWNRVGNDVYLVSINNGLIRDAIFSLFY